MIWASFWILKEANFWGNYSLTIYDMNIMFKVINKKNSKPKTTVLPLDLRKWRMTRWNIAKWGVLRLTISCMILDIFRNSGAKKLFLGPLRLCIVVSMAKALQIMVWKGKAYGRTWRCFRLKHTFAIAMDIDGRF